MSDYIIRMIPSDPYLKITEQTLESAKDLLARKIVCDRIQIRFSNEPSFIDCGSNLHSISCPDCGNKINLSDMLLLDCLEQIEILRQELIGFSFVTLCATAEGYSLYKRNGFDDLDNSLQFSIEDEPTRGVKMYYAMDIE